MRVVDDDRADIDDGSSVALKAEDALAIDEPVEAEHADRLAAGEAGGPGVVGHLHTELDGLLHRLRCQEGVGRQVEHRAFALVEARLADQQAHHRLAATGVELDDQVLLRSPVVPRLQDLPLGVAQELIPRGALGQRVEQDPRVSGRRSGPRTEGGEVDDHGWPLWNLCVTEL